jgi:hypothetical protein
MNPLIGSFVLAILLMATELDDRWWPPRVPVLPFAFSASANGSVILSTKSATNFEE